MELNKENVVTMARSESQHMRTNSGDAVFLFNYEGLLRFANKLGLYVIGVNPTVTQFPQHGVAAMPVSGDPVPVNRDYMHGGCQGSPVVPEWMKEGALPQQPGLQQPYNPTTADQKFAELIIQYTVLQKELVSYKADCERLKTELAKENAWGVQSKEESKKTFDELQRVKEELEHKKGENKRLFDQVAILAKDRDKFLELYSKTDKQLREESEMAFNLSHKLQQTCNLFIKIDSCVEDWRKI